MDESDMGDAFNLQLKIEPTIKELFAQDLGESDAERTGGDQKQTVIVVASLIHKAVNLGEHAIE